MTVDHVEAKPFGNGIDVCPVCGKPSTIGKQKTNADRIRSMTDEELAVFLGNTKAFCCRDRDPSEEFIAEFKTWLKQEAVDNGACSADETSEKVQGGE